MTRSSCQLSTQLMADQDAWIAEVTDVMAEFRIPPAAVSRVSDTGILANMFGGNQLRDGIRIAMTHRVAVVSEGRVELRADDRRNFGVSARGPAGYLMLVDRQRRLAQRFLLTPTSVPIEAVGALVPLSGMSAHELARMLLKRPDLPVTFGAGTLTVVDRVSDGTQAGDEPGVIHLYQKPYLAS